MVSELTVQADDMRQTQSDAISPLDRQPKH